MTLTFTTDTSGIQESGERGAKSMGSFIELNDTLQITTEQGFPAEILDRDSYVKNPVTLDDVKNKIFHFKNKPKARIYHLDPVRVYFVHNINGKWLFWGRIFIETQTIVKNC